MSIVLIAAELVDLLPRNPVPGYTVNWLPSATATPAGSHVAIIPLLSRRMWPTALWATTTSIWRPPPSTVSS
jgi:hypothetical protein